MTFRFISDMRKVAVTFLLRSSHGFIVKRDPSSFLFCRQLANAQDAEVGALSETSIEIRKVPEKRAPTRRRKGKSGCSEQDRRGAEGSLLTEISTGKARTRAKAKITADAHAADLSCIVVTKKASKLTEITAVEAENVTVYEMAKCGKADELAKANANSCFERKDLTKILAELNVCTYRYGSQWEETAHKLLDYGISLAHITDMLRLSRELHCSLRWVDSRLKHFTLLGMSHQEIGRVISSWPTILNVTDSMFQLKIEFWESIGIDRHAVGKMLPVTVWPIIKSLVLLRQNVTFWQDYMKDIHTSAVRIMMLKNPSTMMYCLQRSLGKKLAWLEAQDYDKKWLLRHSSLLQLSLPLLILKAELLKNFGISDARSRAKALFIIFNIKISKLQARFDNLLTAGFSRDQILTMISVCPQLLLCTEEHANLKINYAVNVMNVSLDAIVSSPGVWTHKFETRMKHRHEIIKRLQTLGVLSCRLGLGTMVCMTNADFNRKFVERFQDSVKQADAVSS